MSSALCAHPAAWILASKVRIKLPPSLLLPKCARVHIPAKMFAEAGGVNGTSQILRWRCCPE